MEFALAVQDRVRRLAFVGRTHGNQNLQWTWRGWLPFDRFIAEGAAPRENTGDQGGNRTPPIGKAGSLERDAQQTRAGGLEDQFQLLRAAQASGNLGADVAGEDHFADRIAKPGEIALPGGADILGRLLARRERPGAEEVGVGECKISPR